MKLLRTPPPLAAVATSMPQPSETRIKSRPPLIKHMLRSSHVLESVDTDSRQYPSWSVWQHRGPTPHAVHDVEEHAGPGEV